MKVKGDLYQEEQIVEGKIHQDEIKKMTKQQIEEVLGHKIIIEGE